MQMKSWTISNCAWKNYQINPSTNWYQQVVVLEDYISHLYNRNAKTEKDENNANLDLFNTVLLPLSNPESVLGSSSSCRASFFSSGTTTTEVRVHTWSFRWTRHKRIMCMRIESAPITLNTSLTNSSTNSTNGLHKQQTNPFSTMLSNKSTHRRFTPMHQHNSNHNTYVPWHWHIPSRRRSRPPSLSSP